MALSKKLLDELERAIAKRSEVLEAEIHQDAQRSREDVFSALAGPVTDRKDEALADELSALDDAELSRDLQESRELAAAQGRIREGKYGICEDCGQDIGFERLRAQPAARRCFDCQRVHEKTFPRSGTAKP
jgi:RNA polymerase-binding transcription factor DksA